MLRTTEQQTSWGTVKRWRGFRCLQDVGAADQMFATLDTKIRRAEIHHGQSVLLVDTVGFIQGLPLNLVSAFQATLDEATQADLLVRHPSTCSLATGSGVPGSSHGSVLCP